MNGIYKLRDIGLDATQWLQDFLGDLRKLFNNFPKFPPAHRVLLYNKNTKLISWVQIGTGLTLTDNGQVLYASISENLIWEPMTNGDLLATELVFSGGDVIMVPVRID